MDVYLVLFYVTFGVCIAEMMLNGTWNSFYFRTGIPIFRYEISLTTAQPVPSQSKDIEGAIPDSIFVPIRVRKLSTNEFAIREALWGLGLIRIYYTPLMHGILQFTPYGNVRVIGLVNWFAILFTILFVSVPIGWGHNEGHNHWFALIFPLFLFGFWGFVYFIQRKRFKAVANIAASLNTMGS